MRVCKSFTFEAAHRLPNYPGKCKQLHGHSWRLEVEIIGDINSDGFVIDFSELKQIVNDNVISKLDHSYLNDLIPNPTCENMLVLIFGRLKSHFISDISGFEKLIYELRLWETPDNFATLTKGDIIELTKN